MNAIPVPPAPSASSAATDFSDGVWDGAVAASTGDVTTVATSMTAPDIATGGIPAALCLASIHEIA
jgi:hypothetical protein